MQTVAATLAADRAYYAAAPGKITPHLAWAEQNPGAFAWIEGNAESNDFARSLSMSLRKWGRLTPNQLFAVQKCMARATIIQAKAENAPTISIEPIVQAFERANAGVTKPKLRLGEFVFSPAPAGGKNPGAIYVKGVDGTYLGKVANGRLFTMLNVTPQVEQDILACAADPLNAAIAYGKRYGKCSVCARTLTDPESIDRGIGPVCAERFGW